MKYGKNQWARISSLLTRKTPKQCKARWYEWLDPSIRKVEWSQEEDEKLLHLAKLMPTQWRTIAPIVGRTASQCLERYQQLLDEAEEKEPGQEPGGEAGPSGEDVRKLRPGEIDPNPESKPARPDPVDMDDDEREMLSEARARLANTQGKKAKRKARERQLEEARRLASIQKRRELKAAGINIRFHKKWKGGMDLNADIPFYKPAPVGFHDVSQEQEREERDKKNVLGNLLSKMDGKRRAEIEEDKQYKDAKKIKTKKAAGDYVPAAALKEAQEAEERAILTRKKLSLPAPQMSDSELQEVLRMGKEGQLARSVVESAASSSEEFSRGLLSDYDTGVRAATPLRTPRLPSTAQDSLKVQARNLKAMTELQTPLLGDSLEMEGEVHFETAIPKKNVHATPNPMMAQLTPKIHGVNGNATPRVHGVAVAPPSQTPLRDQMGINTPRIHGSGMSSSASSEFGDDFSNIGTPRRLPSDVSSTLTQQNAVRSQLKSLFASLPKPKNDFEIVVPQVSQKDSDKPSTTEGVQDAEEWDAAQRQQEQERKDAEYRKRSSAVKRDLPRPTQAPQFTPKDEVESLILQEMELMILHDAQKFPAPGQQPVTLDLSSYEDFDEKELAKAVELVTEEVSKLEASMEELKTKFIKTHQQVNKDYLFVPRPKPHHAHLPSLSEMQKLEAYAVKVETCRESMRQEALLSQKQEKKLGVLLGGYMARSQKLTKEIQSTFEEIQDCRMERESFLKLQEMEKIARPYRLGRAKREYNDLLMKDRDKQELYKDLKQQEEELLTWIQAHS